MKGRPTQEQFVIRELQQNGYISRNYCLDLYDLGVRPNITRLAGIIFGLIQAGWEIEGKWERDSRNNRDFVYRVNGMPFKRVVYRVADPSEGSGIKEIVRFEKA